MASPARRAAAGPRGAQPVTVLVTVFNDLRVRATVLSLLRGERLPDRVLLADGGSMDGTWELCLALAAEHPNSVVARQWPGSVAETRAASLHDQDAVPDGILAFLDADETAPPMWLAALVAPIEAADADVTGGPTRPPGPPGSRAEAYWNRHDQRFYDDVVAHDAAALPMGNSAWRTQLLRDIGGFDARLRWGGEDYDVNLRARAAGARFAYVEDAWVWHDQSGLSSYRVLARRMHRYAKGATVAYRKNRSLAERGRAAAKAKRVRHAADVVMLFAKATGFLAGLRAWRRMQRDARTPAGRHG